jgi:hypothetical protein
MSTLDCAVIAACFAWTRDGPTLAKRNTGSGHGCTGASGSHAACKAVVWPVVRPGIDITLTSGTAQPYVSRGAQMAELVDALVSGTSGESRGGSSPLLGTNHREGNNQVVIGKENYFYSGDGQLMPTKKDQPPPDLKYFKQSQK